MSKHANACAPERTRGRANACASDSNSMYAALQPFYRSMAWRNCREAYIKSVGGICERCAAKGIISAGTEVHHKIRLSPRNVKDPKVTLSWENLELLCEDCHHKEHGKIEKRWTCGPDGRVTARRNA